MNYILKQFDEPLVKFSATTDTSEPEIQILWTNEEKAALLPLDLTLTPEGVSRWLRRRTIPKNRAYVHSLLAKCGLNLNRPLSIISICKGLSLNDCYWVIEDGDTASFGNAFHPLCACGQCDGGRTAPHTCGAAWRHVSV